MAETVTMRNALQALVDWCEAHTGAFATQVFPQKEIYEEVLAARDRAMENARKALENARNCDFFDTAVEASAAFEKTYGGCEWCPYNNDLAVCGRMPCALAWAYQPRGN